MKNPVLGRKVLDHVTAHRDQFEMCDFGRQGECGTKACLAGWAMLLSGYTLSDDDEFFRPDGSAVDGLCYGAEAGDLLGLDDAEYWGAGIRLFYEASEDAAIERFRAIVEASESGRDAYVLIFMLSLTDMLGLQAGEAVAAKMRLNAQRTYTTLPNGTQVKQ